jgi:hypothetical protein
MENHFFVEFEVTNPKPANTELSPYRRGVRRAVVSAASEREIPGVLEADVVLEPGEAIDIFKAVPAITLSSGRVIDFTNGLE